MPCSSSDTSAMNTPRNGELIRGLHNLRSEHRGSVLTIGSFDGVHLGHQVVLKQVCEKAKTLNLPSVAMIFEPQPTEFFGGEAVPARLMRFREKVQALHKAGIRRVCCLQFNAKLRGLTAQAFVESILVEGLGVKHLVIGDDFRFGCDRKGDYAFLQQQGDRFGFAVNNTSTLTCNEERISSTRIRQCLQHGDLAEAEALLGKPYSISGRVGYGQQLGRTIGAPTANVQLRRHRSPLSGVFAVKVHHHDGRILNGVANVGVRPTVGGDLTPLLEVHVLDFAESLYTLHLTIEFRHKIRDERKFDSIDTLSAQIQCDMADARAFFAQEACHCD